MAAIVRLLSQRLSGLDQFRYAPAMRVRSGFMMTMAGLAVTALLLGGLAYMTLMAFTGSECTSDEEGLIPVLAAQKILTAHPEKAAVQDGYTGCFADDPFPYAGNFYEFTGPMDGGQSSPKSPRRTSVTPGRSEEATAFLSGTVSPATTAQTHRSPSGMSGSVTTRT
ncbi:hypothetical protein [Nonomuraea cavernae]|uniref:hypothetical protein n=1 Tax=Nonomuraea cavernae TaxID=2045107 RepID=UPI0033D2C54C